MNELSDSLLVLLFCGLPIFAIMGIAAVWTVRPQWIERLAGAKRPVKKGRKR